MEQIIWCFVSVTVTYDVGIYLHPFMCAHFDLPFKTVP